MLRNNIISPATWPRSRELGKS